eukprot:9314342-Pyramimonas_sp.AAC.2
MASAGADQPLHAAARPGHAAAVTALAEAGADVHARTELVERSPQACERYPENGVEVETALYMAAPRGDHAAAISALAAAGADVNMPVSLYCEEECAENSETALYVAVNCNHVEAVRALLQAGVDVTRIRGVGTIVPRWIRQHTAEISCEAYGL